MTIVTIFKSAMPVAILMFAFLFGLQKPSIRLTLIILVIVFGTALAVVPDLKQTALPPFAVLMMSLSVIAGGLRWTLTALLLTKKGNNPLATMMLLAPPMGLSMAVVSLLFGEAKEYATLFHHSTALLIICFGGGNFSLFS